MGWKCILVIKPRGLVAWRPRRTLALSNRRESARRTVFAPMHLMPMSSVLAAAGMRLALCGALALASPARPAAAEAAHAIAMHGAPAMPDGFTSPGYAN